MTDNFPKNMYDVIVIGGGQAGLIMEFYLRRTNFNYLILDAHKSPGMAWLKAWDLLNFFARPVEFAFRLAFSRKAGKIPVP